MRIKTSIITTLLIFTVLASCGFEKIYKKDNKTIYIETIKIEGAKKIAYKIKNNILLIANKNSENKYNIRLKTEKNKNSKIKDIKGKVTRYRLTIKVVVDLENLRNSLIISKTFEKQADYDVEKNHSKTLSNENNAIDGIIQDLSNDIINFITISTEK